MTPAEKREAAKERARLKLNDAQKIFLILIDDSTDIDWTTGKLNRYWTPPNGNKQSWSETFKATVFVDGSGDARTLKALESRTLTKRKGETPYAYAITEDGHKLAEEIRADRDEIERLYKQVTR